MFIFLKYGALFDYFGVSTAAICLRFSEKNMVKAEYQHVSFS